MTNGFLGQNLEKRSHTEKVNITIKFYIFQACGNKEGSEGGGKGGVEL